MDATPSPSDPDLAVAGGSDPDGARRPRPFVAVGTGFALVALVAGGIWYQSSRGRADGDVPAAAGSVAAAAVDEGMQLGTTGGPIVDIYVDYQCVHCAELDEVIGSELLSLAASGDAELVIRPVKFVNRASGRGAAALYCAAPGGEAFAMHQYLLANIGGDLSADALTAEAGTLGLDKTAFATCLADHATTAWVNGVTSTADADGITSIPAVFVDGTRLSAAQLASAPAFRAAVLAGA